MFLKKITVSFCALGLCLSTIHVFGQSTGNSPYSQFGIGDVSPEGFGRNQQMGNSGVATFSPNFVNNVNPATLSSLAYTNFDFGVAAGYKTMSTNTTQATDAGGNFGHLAISFPVSSRWGTSFGIKPYSSVNYNIKGTQTISKAGSNQTDALSSIYQYEGKGNLVEFYFSNGAKLNKNFSLGLTAGYIFGTLKYFNKNTLNDYASAPVSTENRETYSQIVLKPGIFFRKQISYIDVEYARIPSIRRVDSTGKFVDSVLTKQKLSLNEKRGKSSEVYFNIAATGDFFTDLNTTNFVALSYQNSSGQAVKYDTIVEPTTYQKQLPFGYHIGTSFDKPYKWTIAFDFSQKYWGSFSSDLRSTNLMNSYSLNLGGEYFSSLGLSNKGKNTLILRGGVYYQNGPLQFGSIFLKDAGLTLGCSFQLPKIKNEGIQYPKFINLGVALGQRGTTQNDLILERYIRFNISVSVNDRWFIRPKHD